MGWIDAISLRPLVGGILVSALDHAEKASEFPTGRRKNQISCEILLFKPTGLESNGVRRLRIKGFASGGSKLNKGSEWMRMMTSNVWIFRYF